MEKYNQYTFDTDFDGDKKHLIDAMNKLEKKSELKNLFGYHFKTNSCTVDLCNARGLSYNNILKSAIKNAKDLEELYSTYGYTKTELETDLSNPNFEDILSNFIDYIINETMDDLIEDIEK